MSSAVTTSSAVSGNLVVPVVLWGKSPPSHRIRCMTILPNNSTILTGTTDGQICIWNIGGDLNIVPKYLLFGHSAPITCIAPAGKNADTTNFVSSSRNGITCLWDSVDGRCVDSVQTSNVHTVIKPHNLRTSSGSICCRLFCVGHYSEILIMEPTSLQILFTMSSRVEPDWVTAFSIISPNPKNDIVIGLSNAGMVKIWSLTDWDQRDLVNPIFEEESKQIRCQGAVTLTACPHNPRAMLVVSPQVWQVFDASDFSMLLNQMSPTGEHLLGGVFLKIDKLAVWCSDGNAYFYQLPRTATFGSSATTSPFDRTTCYCVLRVQSDRIQGLCSEPTFYLARSGTKDSERLKVVRGDSEGCLSVWEVPEVSDRSIVSLQQEALKGFPELQPTFSQSFCNVWSSCGTPKGIVDHVGGNSEITTTMYVASQGRLVLGTREGPILLVAATKALKKELLEKPTGFGKERESAAVRMLSGHRGAVTCLLYPYEEHSRYDPAVLISGGADFCVCIWDLNTGGMVHKFCVQAGPITRLLVPPPTCNTRILHSVCSVATDHSVALLSLKEQKCLLLASRHLYPVREIRWRPLDDFLLVQCEDSTVYVWQMETSHLDRIITGIVADEILGACQDQVGQEEGEDEAGASQAVQMLRAIKHRNVNAMKRIAGAEAAAVGAADSKPSVLMPPMLIQGLRTYEEDSDSHLILFNVEALIIGLLAEENTELTPSGSESSIGTEKGDGSPLTGLLARAKDKVAENVLSASPNTQRKATSEKSALAKQVAQASDYSLPMEIAQILLSLLHAWNQDKDLDRVCVGKLGLLRPKSGVCFGSVSRQGHLSLLLPTGVAPDRKVKKVEGLDAFGVFATGVHWQLSRSLTTQHLLAVVATGNTLMSMQNAAFLPDQERKRRLVKRLSSTQPGWQPPYVGITPDAVEALGSEQAQIKQGWSLLAALHCVLLPELIGLTYQPPRIELLARRWQERCLELREAAQALLLRELSRLGTPGRKALIEYWAPFLPTLLDQSLSIFGSTRLLGINPPSALSSAVTTPTTSSGNGTPSGGGDTMQGQFRQNLMVGSWEPLLAASDRVDLSAGQYGRVDHSLQQVRRNQATAVVLLAVIGAEFGQEIAQHTPALGIAAPEGFSDKDYSLARATSQSLLELLLQPPSQLLPSYSPLRRAAIDLLGRGFVVWQPYLDIAKVLLGLLDICANSEKLIPPGYALFPLNPRADACRTARHALSLIATARPQAFIAALSKEVARFNQAAHNQTLAHGSGSPLLRARNEILRIIEVMSEKNYSDLVDLMIAVGEILIHCLDTNLMKHKSLSEIFPPITKFYMVSYCPNSRRLAFGGRNGCVVLHELRAGKAQTIQAHSRAVTACSFSEDGKYMATYSADEGKVNFWHAHQSFLGMGQSQVKCVKQIPAPQSWPVATPGGSPQVFKARIVWIAPKALTLMLSNGKEHRFSM